MGHGEGAMNFIKWPLLLTFALATLAPLGKTAEQDLYDFAWLDPDKKVYVLQNKIYSKKNSLYLNLGYLLGLSSTYQSVRGGKAALGFYFSEEWAIEIFYHQYHNTNNQAYDALKHATDDNITTPIRKFHSKAGGFLLFSPFYGKINTFNQIIYFDLSFGIGGGTLKGESNYDTVAIDTTPEKFKNESFPALHFKTDLRIYATTYLHIGLEFHHSLYRGSYVTDTGNPTTTLSANEISLLVGFSL